MPVLERMMAKNPKDRYQTPAEVALALKPFTLATAIALKEGDSGTLVVEESPASRRRRRNIMAVAAALLFVFVGLLGAAVYRIATDKGELVITSESPDVKVIITRGGEVVDVIDTKTDKQIRLVLRSGDYELELKGAPEGLKLDIERAKLTRGETVLATIFRETPNASASKYIVLPIDKVASAVSTKSLFTGGDWERLIFPTWGKQEVLGIPFDVIDPKADSVKNAIVLYGPLDPHTREMPHEVKLKCDSAAKAIHLLSGVAGWGSKGDGKPLAPGDVTSNEKTVCMIVRLHYRDGNTEDHELINGVHFSTTGAEEYVNVPGSRLALRLIKPQADTCTQIRYLAIEPKNPTKLIEEIEFIKGMKGDVTAPVVMAVTVERPGPSGLDVGESLTPKPPPAKKPPDGVVAWWRADEDAKDSVGDNHGELKGGVTFSPGIAGKAFRLDGATRYVEVPRSDRWGFGKRDFSIDLWVQFRALTPSRDYWHPNATFIGCDEGSGWERHKWMFEYRGEFLDFHIVNGNQEKSGFYAKAAFSPEVDQWYHLAVTRSRGTFTIYVNGAPVASEKVDMVIPNPDAPLTIGQAEGSGFFSGLMDEVAIYDRALSADEVKARWKALASTTTKEVGEKVGEVRQFNGHTQDVKSLAFFKDGRRFVSVSWDQTIRVWDIDTGKELQRIDMHTDSTDGIALCPDQRHLLTGGNDNTVRLWDLETSKELDSFRAGNRRIAWLAVSPDSRWVLSASHDDKVRLHDMKDLKKVDVFAGHAGCVEKVAISPDGRLGASAGSADGTVRLWDLDKRKEIGCLQAHKAPDGAPRGVDGVAFSADGKRILSGSRDNKLRLWDVSDQKELQVFEGHTGTPVHVAMSPDGRRALSSGGDGTVRLWDVNTGKELCCFARHNGMVWSAVFSPDGRYAISGGGDHTIRLWRLPDSPPAKNSP
jgi:WD40 repeat protein